MQLKSISSTELIGIVTRDGQTVYRMNFVGQRQERQIGCNIYNARLDDDDDKVDLGVTKSQYPPIVGDGRGANFTVVSKNVTDGDTVPGGRRSVTTFDSSTVVELRFIAFND